MLEELDVPEEVRCIERIYQSKVPVQEKLEEQVRLPSNFIGMPKGLEVPLRTEVVESIYGNAKKVATVADQGGMDP